MSGFCGECGSALKANNTFCNKCGSPVRNTAPVQQGQLPPQPAQMQQPSTNNYQHPTQSTHMPPQYVPAKKSKLIPVIVGSLVLVCVAFFVMFFVFLRDGGEESITYLTPTPQTTPAPQTTPVPAPDIVETPTIIGTWELVDGHEIFRWTFFGDATGYEQEILNNQIRFESSFFWSTYNNILRKTCVIDLWFYDEFIFTFIGDNILNIEGYNFRRVE